MSAIDTLARARVPLGFVCGIAALALADPTRQSLAIGAAVAAAGEAIRIWAAGHLEKSREVTTSGPYAFTRHPLYLGSGIIAAGFVIAANSWAAAALAAVYLLVTYTSAIRREEAFLTERFGAAYPDYKAGRMPGAKRAFSFSRAMLTNREYRAVAGIAVALAILGARLLMR